MNTVLIVRPSTESARVTDTRITTLPADGPESWAPDMRVETEAEAARRVGLMLPSRRHRWWSLPVVVASAALLVLVPLSAALPSKVIAEKENRRLQVDQPVVYANTPSSAQPVDDRIQFGDLGDLAEQFPPEGDIFFVTTQSPSQSLLSWFAGRTEAAIEFLTDEERNGFETPQQRRVFALESMRTSEQVAEFVALQRVGFDVSLQPGDVLIQSMVCLQANEVGNDCEVFSPSAAVLDPGDRIIEVEGVRIDGVEDLSRVLRGRAPGDVVEMQIERAGGGIEDVEVELTASSDDPDRTIVGFFPFDTRAVELPFELNIDTGSIGGPSAGLAFTLTLIDELTSGELTGGSQIAVTGTIELDGSVGAIGGLRQKASAVMQAGVDVFIVPTAQGEDDIAAAREAGGDDLEIITVANLEEALVALAELGGAPIPPPPEIPTNG